MKSCGWNDISNLTNFHINSLGFYDSCISNKSLKYYLLYSPPNEKADIMKSVNSVVSLTIGLCAPRKCTIDSLNKTVAEKFAMIKGASVGNVTIHDIEQVLENSPKFDIVGFLFVAITIFFVMWTLYSTYKTRALRERIIGFHVAGRLNRKKKLDFDQVEKRIKRKLKSSIWKQFDLITNIKKITIPRIKSPSVQAFDIMRVVSMVFVLMGHEFSERLPYSVNFKDSDPGFYNYVSDSVSYGIIQNGIYAVSTFFFMGGFVSGLTGMSFKYKAKEAGKGCCSFWFYMIRKRFARLTPLVVYMCLYYWKIVPLFLKGNSRVDFDEKTHFSGYALFNTAAMVGWTASYGGPIIAPWLWYLQCDMQMYLLVPLIIYSCKKKTMMKIFIVLISLSFVFGILVFGVLGLKFGTFGFLLIYVQSLFRARIYYLGCLIGALSYRKKEKRDEGKSIVERPTEEIQAMNKIVIQDSDTASYVDVKKSIIKMQQSVLSSKSKKEEKESRENDNTIMIFISLIIFFSLFYWFHKCFQIPNYNQKNDRVSNALYCVFAPILIVGSMIVFLTKILTVSKTALKMVQNNRLIQMLANLSFSMYLFHYTAIMLNLFRFKNYNNLYFMDIFAGLCCDFFYTFVLGVFGALFIEIPLSNCWKVYVEEKYFEPGISPTHSETEKYSIGGFGSEDFSDEDLNS